MQAEHVGHGVKAGFLVKAPQGRLDGAAGEDRAVLGAVGQFDALALAGQNDGVLADDGTAAQGGKADRALLARAGVTVAHAHRRRIQIDATAFRRRLP